MKTSEILFSPESQISTIVHVLTGKQSNSPGRMGIVFLSLLASVLAICSITVLAPTISAQGSPKISSLDPAEGKANDAITVKGESLAKGSVSGIFLSDDKTDFKADIVEQAADKITFKVPQVKAGDYNIAIQVGTNILIQPLRFAVK